jgi:hypothetical protein
MLSLYIRYDRSYVIEDRLRTKHYDKRAYFNCSIGNFRFICSNIPAYEVYISQLIRYSRDCGSYHDFLDRELLLTRKLLNQRAQWLSLSNHFKNFTIVIMTWLTVRLRNICVTNDLVYVPPVVITIPIQSFPQSRN